MLYNATMSVIYEMYASVDGNTLTLEYDNPSPDATDAKKFMFIGNSSTYFNGTPIKFKALAEAAGVNTHVVYCTYGAAYLSEYADEKHERGIAFRTHLRNGFDYVVLQDAGAATYEKSKPACDILVPLIKESGATPLLYMRYSGEKVAENRKDSAKVHYDNYTKLGADFDITVAPAAEAFLICTEKYPEINLYADDNAHHSKEGSYMIACVWLYCYLGIDPRGNTYDAQMDEATVKALQECAYQACEIGYFNPKELPPESTEESLEESSEVINNNDQQGGSNAEIYIAIAAGAVIVAGIAFIAIYLKKKK